jgi:beta-galactosidase
MLELLKIGGAKTWMTPEIIQTNRLPSRATAFSYPDHKLALANDRDASPWYLSLNGEWDFHLAQKPEDVPAEFIQPGFSPASQESWMKMPVPGNWTLHGTFDKPQ